MRELFTFVTGNPTQLTVQGKSKCNANFYVKKKPFILVLLPLHAKCTLH